VQAASALDSSAKSTWQRRSGGQGNCDILSTNNEMNAALAQHEPAQV
jgi:hypothetical protein